jgi:serine/threonine protein kinase
LWYRAPELLLGSSSYGPSIDVWAAGATISEMITGSPAFAGSSELQVIAKMSQGLGSNLIWPGAHQLPRFKMLKLPLQIGQATPRLKTGWQHLPGAADLLSRMMAVDPSKRIDTKSASQHASLQLEVSGH